MENIQRSFLWSLAATVSPFIVIWLTFVLFISLRVHSLNLVLMTGIGIELLAGVVCLSRLRCHPWTKFLLIGTYMLLGARSCTRS